MDTARRAKYRVEFIKDNKRKAQKYRWRITASNGKILCHSEWYANYGAMKNIVYKMLEYISKDGLIYIKDIDE